MFRVGIKVWTCKSYLLLNESSTSVEKFISDDKEEYCNVCVDWTCECVKWENVSVHEDGGSKRLFLIGFFLLPLEQIAVFVFLLESFYFRLIRWSGFDWNLLFLCKLRYSLSHWQATDSEGDRCLSFLYHRSFPLYIPPFTASLNSQVESTAYARQTCRLAATEAPVALS